MSVHMQQIDTEGTGRVLLLYGTVKAVSKDGMERILHPGNIVFAGEEIITGPDGMISMVMNNAEHTQLDLGRSSTIVLDNEVLGIADNGDSIAEIEDIQKALQENTFDPTQVLDTPAAGEEGAGEGGGSHPYIVFPETGLEVIPDSGAETTGISRSFTEQNDLDTPLAVEENINFGVIETISLAPAAITPPVPSETGGSAPVIPVPPVDQQPEAGDFNAMLSEDDLPAGSDPDKEPTTITGDLDDLGITTGDGQQTLTFAGGQSITLDGSGNSITVNSEHGSLEFHDDGTWQFTLTGNADHPNAGATGENDQVDDLFDYTITDADGDSAGGTMTFTILDDGPVAVNDQAEATEGGEAISGNVITGNTGTGQGADAIGADIPGTVTSFTYTDTNGHTQTATVPENGLVTVTTLYGSLTMGPDGTYQYTPNNIDDTAQGVTDPGEEISYTLTDGDGDTSTANLTIAVDQVPYADDFAARINEDDLANGTDPDKEPTTITGDLDDLGIIAGDGEHTIAFAGGQSITLDNSGDSITLTGSHGTLVFQDDGTWSFNLPNSIHHPNAGATDEADSLDDAFDYTITDVDGDSAGGTMTFAILDDGPVAVNDSDTVVEGESVTGNVISGEKNGVPDPDLGPDQVGADDPGRISAFTYTDANGDLQTAYVPGNGSIQVTTEHGELTMHADGTYDYTADPFSNQETGTLEFDQGAVPNGVEIHAWDFGSAYVGNGGQFDPDSADDDNDITMTGSGMGVDGGRVRSQIGYEPGNDTSEALSVTFTDGPVTSAEVTLSRLFPNERGNQDYDERGRWEAFDENGNKVGEGVIGGDQTSHIVSGAVDPGQPFSHLVFTALPYPGQGNYTGDSSDYYLNQIDYTRVFDSPQEQITYTLTDGDGDTAEATLTIDVADAAPTAGDATQHAILDIEDSNAVTGSIDIDYGADSAGSDLAISGYQTDAQGYAIDDNGDLIVTTNGSRIVYQDDGHGGLIALEEGSHDQVFTVQVDPVNTTYTVNYTSQLPATANHAMTYDLTATDGDGSTADTRVQVSFDDHDGTITGTELNEVISGSSGNDVIRARAGDDTVYGRGGDDTISGNDGNDVLHGGADKDTIHGNNGDDIITGDGGDDDLYGDHGDDTLYGGAGHDELHGNPGDDALYGGAGDDTLRGGQDNDTLSGGDGSDHLYGWTGDDTLAGGDGDDRLNGASGEDILHGDGGDDRLDGGTDNDILVGDGGADILLGRAGDDTLFGGEETDGDTADMVTGGDGADTFVDVNNDDDGLGGDVATDFYPAEGDQNLDHLIPPPTLTA